MDATHGAPAKITPLVEKSDQFCTWRLHMLGCLGWDVCSGGMYALCSIELQGSVPLGLIRDMREAGDSYTTGHPYLLYGLSRVLVSVYSQWADVHGLGRVPDPSGHLCRSPNRAGWALSRPSTCPPSSVPRPKHQRSS